MGKAPPVIDTGGLDGYSVGGMAVICPTLTEA